MPQSAELAGGAGVTFEGHVAAYYLAAMLDEAHAPGIEDRTVVITGSAAWERRSRGASSTLDELLRSRARSQK